MHGPRERFNITRFLVISHTRQESHFDIVVSSSAKRARQRVSRARGIDFLDTNCLSAAEIDKIHVAMSWKSSDAIEAKFKKNTGRS